MFPTHNGRLVFSGKSKGTYLVCYPNIPKYTIFLLKDILIKKDVSYTGYA